MAKGTTILKTKEIQNNAYFVYAGVVGVYVVDPETQERTFFQKLIPGSAFNVVTSLIGYLSLFEFVAETECALFKLSSQDVEKLSRSNYRLKELTDQVHSMLIVKGVKYDFDYYIQKQAKPENEIDALTTKLRGSLDRSRTFRHRCKFSDNFDYLCI